MTRCRRCLNNTPDDMTTRDGLCVECVFDVEKLTTDPPTYDHPTVLDVAVVVLVIVVGWFMFSHVVLWIVR